MVTPSEGRCSWDVTLHLAYRLQAPTQEEALSAAWRAHDEEITPIWWGAEAKQHG